METLLEHYGVGKMAATGRVGPLVNPDGAREEFGQFKRLVSQHRGERKGEHFHTYRAEELFQKIFGGANRYNRDVYKGK